MRGTETIQVFRDSADLDRWGEQTEDLVPDEIRGCVVLPRGVGGEENQNASTVISGLQVFCPPGSDVKATDEVVVRGTRYEVDGEPGDYRSASGRPKVLLVNLRKATG